jgi:DNA ligase-associated metallophosphoesterase
VIAPGATQSMQARAADPGPPMPPRAGMSIVTLRAANQTLMLLPERVVFLPESDTLLVADAQIGNVARLRRHGVQVQGDSTEESLAVLSRLVRRLDVARVIFLGDFLHSEHEVQPETVNAFVRWRELHGAVECTLVRGTHRSGEADPAAVFDIQAFDEPLMHRGLALTHHPRRIAGSYVLGGHLRPGVSVRVRSLERERLPCFVFSKHMGILPAFGAGLDLSTIRPTHGEKVFAAAADRVFELELRPRRR